MLRLSALATLLVCLTYANAFGQQTRAELLEQQRAERARSVAPYTPNAVERALLYLDEKRIIERLGQELTGIYPRIGGFTTGSGFALGVGLRHALPGTNDFEVDASVAMSAKGYKSVDFNVRAPALLRGRLELDGGTRWWDYTQEDYFGLGESLASNRIGLSIHRTRRQPRRAPPPASAPVVERGSRLPAARHRGWHRRSLSIDSRRVHR